MEIGYKKLCGWSADEIKVCGGLILITSLGLTTQANVAFEMLHYKQFFL